MTSDLETVRDALTIKKLVREVRIGSDMVARVDKLADQYLDQTLPRLSEETHKEGAD